MNTMTKVHYLKAHILYHMVFFNTLGTDLVQYDVDLTFNDNL